MLCFVHLFDCLFFLAFTGKIASAEDFEGDILLTKLQRAMTSPFHQDVAAADVWEKASFLWPERTVPYYIPSDLGENGTVKNKWYTSLSVSSSFHVKIRRVHITIYNEDQFI